MRKEVLANINTGRGFWTLIEVGSAYQSLFKDLKDGKPFRLIAIYHNIPENQVREAFHSQEYKNWLKN